MPPVADPETTVNLFKKHLGWLARIPFPISFFLFFVVWFVFLCFVFLLFVYVCVVCLLVFLFGFFEKDMPLPGAFSGCRVKEARPRKLPAGPIS